MESLEGEDVKSITINGVTLHPEYMRNRFYARWKRSVYVANLNWNAEEWHIEELFSQCGEILNINIFRDRNGRSKGQCTIEYLTRGGAIRALDKNESEFLGRDIYVKLANKP